MALTRKFLKGMGLTEEQIESVIDAHTETVDGLKDQISKFKADAEKLDEVQKELDGIKSGKDWKAEYEKLSKDFAAFKSDVAGKEALAAKEKAYRALLTAESIPEKYHDRIVKMTDLSGVDMDGDALKDEKALRDAIKTDWSDFVATTERRGADVATPPANNGTRLTKEDIYKRDEKGRYVMSTAERQKALAEIMQK